MDKYVDFHGYTLKECRESTQYGAQMRIAYNNATATKLEDCYKRPSKAKQHAFQWCMQMCKKCGGTNPRIVSHNAHMFTFGFESPYGALIYVTASHDYIVF